MNTQPRYVNNGAAYATVNTSKAESLLSGLGFTKGSDGYYQPNYGPQAGQDLTLTIQSTSGNAVRQQTEQLFQAQMKTIGIKIKIQNYDADTFFGTNLPTGGVPDRRVRLGLHAVRLGQPVDLLLVHQHDRLRAELGSTTPTRRSTRLLATARRPRSPTQETADYNAADKQLWSDMVTLPLYQKPQFFAWIEHLREHHPERSSNRGPVERQPLGHQGLVARP